MEACSYMPDFKETAIALQLYAELVSVCLFLRARAAACKLGST